MENPTVDSSTQLHNTHSPQSPKRFPFSLLIVFSLVALFVLGGILLIIANGKKKEPVKTRKSTTLPTPTTPPFAETTVPFSGLGILYVQTDKTPGKSGGDVNTYYLTDTSNLQKVQINYQNFAKIVFPSGKRFMSFQDSAILTSPDGDPTNMKMIINFKGIGLIGGAVPSPDEKTIFYELLRDRSFQYWTIQYDGSSPELVYERKGNETLVGYDFEKKFIFTKRVEPGGTTVDLVAINVKTKEEKIIATGTVKKFDAKLSPDMKVVYTIENNNSIHILDPVTEQKEVLFSTASVGIPDSQDYMLFYPSPDNKWMYIIFGNGDGKFNTYLFNLQSKEVSTAINDTRLKELRVHSFSPDGKYIMLYSSSNRDPSRAVVKPDPDHPDEKGIEHYYSEHFCLWDIDNQKIIPFFHCELTDTGIKKEILNMDVLVFGWIRDVKGLKLKYNAVPTPRPTYTSEPTISADSLSKSDPSIIGRRTREVLRTSNIRTLKSIIEEYKTENGVIPEEITTTVQPISSDGADICKDVVPKYIMALPVDPLKPADLDNPNTLGGAVYDCSKKYDTGYTIVKDNNGNVTVGSIQE